MHITAGQNLAKQLSTQAPVDVSVHLEKVVVPLQSCPLLEQRVGLALLQALSLLQALHLSSRLAVQPVELGGSCPHRF